MHQAAGLWQLLAASSCGSLWRLMFGCAVAAGRIWLSCGGIWLLCGLIMANPNQYCQCGLQWLAAGLWRWLASASMAIQ